MAQCCVCPCQEGLGPQRGVRERWEATTALLLLRVPKEIISDKVKY